MLLKATLDQIALILQDLKNPYTAKDGTAIDVGSLLKSTKKLASWCFPDLSEDSVSVIVRCRDCKYYKRYRTKDNPKAVPFYACSVTRRKTDPNFFCGDGNKRASKD